MTFWKIIFIILVLSLPAVLVGYINWDITYITTIGTWEPIDRGGFLVVSICCSFVTALMFHEDL